MQDAHEGAQGTLTVLFTDIEGSTDLRSRLGDAAANELIQTHESLIRGEVGRCGGTEAKSLGDGFMILFSSAGQAIKCAVEIQRAIERHNNETPSSQIKVRIGINTGDVTREGADVYGAAVNAASRICDKAQGGQILIGQTVKDLAGFLPGIRIVDRGLFWLKGFPNRWRLFDVLWRDRAEEPRSADTVQRQQRPRIEASLPRAQGQIVGREAEMNVLREELGRAHAGALTAVALEGEAGIGKTRALEFACETAEAMEPPFSVLRVAADEEIRGPFFLLRTLFATEAIERTAEEALAMEPLERARDAIAGRGGEAKEGLSPQERMLRVFDEATNAIRAMAQQQPLALLLDDLQWADVDSIRLIRYLVRTVTASPIFLLITLRPDTDASENGAANLVADLERMHIARHLRLQRFTRGETAMLLREVLGGGEVAPAAVDSVHARAEGVPFFIEEFARAYREAKVLQVVGGKWTMTKLSGPSVPSSVQSLISRRLAQLTDDAKSLLSDAAVLGRRFRVRDLSIVLSSVDGMDKRSEMDIGDVLEPAIRLGIISELPEDSRLDYAFTHDQIQATLAESLTRQRKRRLHGAVVDMMQSQDGSEANLSLLAYHALAAGDEKRGVSFAIKAARQSVDALAPEEALRIVDQARPSAASREDRVELLEIKDDALSLLDRGQERVANLAELAALTSAVGDPSVEMDVKLRRASALREMREYETATELASQVLQAAAAMSDARLQLRACLELGQALARSPLGEAFWPLLEVDVEAASEPYERAVDLARQLGDRSSEAAALRELGVLETGRVRTRILAELGQGNRPLDVIFNVTDQGYMEHAKELIGQALHIYEELGDHRGAMSSLIAMAYTHRVEATRRGEAGRIEQIRRLHANMRRFTDESRRGAEEVQMLYSIHVYARAHIYPDLALERGREAYEAARAMGDRWMEFLSAGGVAVSHLSLLEIDEAEAWLDLAAAALQDLPEPVVARRMETWRGLLAAAKGDAPGAASHLETAARMAAQSGSPAARCEATALLALELAKLAAAGSDRAFLERAKAAAAEARQLAANLPGRLAWEAQAWAAESLAAQLEGDSDKAAAAARVCLEILEPRFNRELYLDVLWITARCLIGGGAPEGADLAGEIKEHLSVIEASTVDETIKQRWFNVPMHKELAALAGYEFGESTLTSEMPVGLDDTEVEVLGMLTSGKTEAEIAEEIGEDRASLERRMSELFSKLGVSSRSAATEYALKAGVA